MLTQCNTASSQVCAGVCCMERGGVGAVFVPQLEQGFNVTLTSSSMALAASLCLATVLCGGGGALMVLAQLLVCGVVGSADVLIRTYTLRLARCCACCTSFHHLRGGACHHLLLESIPCRVVCDLGLILDASAAGCEAALHCSSVLSCWSPRVWLGRPVGLACECENCCWQQQHLQDTPAAKLLSCVVVDVFWSWFCCFKTSYSLTAIPWCLQQLPAAVMAHVVDAAVRQAEVQQSAKLSVTSAALLCC